jgi:hypothetical protein
MDRADRDATGRVVGLGCGSRSLRDRRFPQRERGPVPNSRALTFFSLSAAVSYGAFALGHLLFDVGIPETAVVLIPGFAFYLALHGSLEQPMSARWRMVMALMVVGGWYLAYRFAYQSISEVEPSLYFAGAVAGAIGGAAVFGALVPHPKTRAFANAALLVIAGAAIGAITLPAGFLFGKPANTTFLFLLFLPWQVGMGSIVVLMSESGARAPVTLKRT